MNWKRIKQLLNDVLDEGKNEKITPEELMHCIRMAGILPFTTYICIWIAIKQIPNLEQTYLMFVPSIMLFLLEKPVRKIVKTKFKK
jgi:hypothetical protein